MEKQVKGGRHGTKVLVLGVGWRVAADALLHTLGRVLDAVAGRPGAVDVMLAGGDGVGSAACRQNQSESTFIHATNAGAAARGSQPTDFGAVQASSHQARLGPECPGRTGVAAETAASGGEIIDIRQSWLALSLRESRLKFL